MPSPPFVCTAQKGNTMPEQALQVAFEIKTACDEISRRLLRWHWERKPGGTVWMRCWSILLPASRKARIIMTVCRILPARPAGSSWTLPFVCGCCWTRRTMPPAHWTCWATRRTPLPPAMPATPSAPPATKLLMRQLQQTAHRRAAVQRSHRGAGGGLRRYCL